MNVNNSTLLPAPRADLRVVFGWRIFPRCLDRDFFEKMLKNKIQKLENLAVVFFICLHKIKKFILAITSKKSDSAFFKNKIIKNVRIDKASL